MTHINLIEVHPSVQTTTSSKQSLTWPRDSCVQYLGDFLCYVKTKAEHNRMLWMLPTDARVKIRALRINRRKTHRGKNRKPSSNDVEPRSVNHSNLTQVNITNDKIVRISLNNLIYC